MKETTFTTIIVLTAIFCFLIWNGVHVYVSDQYLQRLDNCLDLVKQYGGHFTTEGDEYTCEFKIN